MTKHVMEPISQALLDEFLLRLKRKWPGVDQRHIPNIAQDWYVDKESGVLYTLTDIYEPLVYHFDADDWERMQHNAPLVCVCGEDMFRVGPDGDLTFWVECAACCHKAIAWVAHECDG